MASFGITRASVPQIFNHLSLPQLKDALEEQKLTVSKAWNEKQCADYNADILDDAEYKRATDEWAREALIKHAIEEHIKTRKY